MRRLLLLCLVVVLSGLALASAANLEVDGGVLQVFDVGVEVEPPPSLTETSTTFLMESTSTTMTSSATSSSNEPTEPVGTESP